MKKMYAVMGPTASGKSDFAINLAQKVGGEIVNTDSLQVYEDVPLLTAKPTNEDMSVLAINNSSAISAIGALALSVMATTFAPLLLANLTASTILFEYLGKLIAISKSLSFIEKSCSNI